MLVLVTCIATFFSTCSLSETFTAHCRDYPPELSFENGKCVGVLPDLVTDIVNELGHQIVWIKAPWIRSIKDSKNGKVDLLIRHSMTIERRLFLQAIPYAYYIRNISFYKSPTFKSDIKSYEDLKKVNVGAIRGNFYSPRFSTIEAEELTLVGTTKQLVGMLKLARIDVVITSTFHNIELFDSHFEKPLLLIPLLTLCILAFLKIRKQLGFIRISRESCWSTVATVRSINILKDMDCQCRNRFSIDARLAIWCYLSVQTRTVF